MGKERRKDDRDNFGESCPATERHDLQMAWAQSSGDAACAHACRSADDVNPDE
jgi:hypothetical protein